MPSAPPRTTAPGPIFATSAATAAFVLLFCAFAPRFSYWQGLDLPSSEHTPPEINRAIDTLRQLEDPWVRIKTPSNRVINWRLLFPILGHHLRLPRWAFLALPYLGCLLVLGAVARVVGREARDRWIAFLAATLMGTASWFFVSTGWLAYFDSWCILALLVVGFSGSRPALALACLLAPWVDERFILALPLALVVRFAYFDGGAPRSRAIAEGVTCLALVSPYCALRILALATAQDVGSAAHIRDLRAFQRDPRQFLDGLWSGLRALWIPAVASVGLALRWGRGSRAALLLLAIPATALANSIVAADLSRSASTLITASLLGLVLLLRRRPALARWTIVALLAFNLAAPARHVIAGWVVSLPIRDLFHELRVYRDPPPSSSSLFLNRGLLYLKARRPDEALREFDAVVRANPSLAAAHLQRGICLSWLGRPAEAEESLSTAIRLAPLQPDGYYIRGLNRRQRGQLPAAVSDLSRALELIPRESPSRRDLEDTLAVTRGELTGGR